METKDLEKFDPSVAELTKIVCNLLKDHHSLTH